MQSTKAALVQALNATLSGFPQNLTSPPAHDAHPDVYTASVMVGRPAVDANGTLLQLLVVEYQLNLSSCLEAMNSYCGSQRKAVTKDPITNKGCVHELNNFARHSLVHKQAVHKQVLFKLPNSTAENS